MTSPPRNPNGSSQSPASGSTPLRAEVHVSELIVAKIAAFTTSQIPGVAELRHEIGTSALRRVGKAARSLAGDPFPDERYVDGVTACVHQNEGTVDIGVDIVVELGASCIEVAETIQQQVGTNVEFNTGLTSEVTVNIVDIEFDDRGTASGS